MRLTMLGGLVLQQDGRLHTGPAAQRRRLALLAVIAAAGGRGVSRDRLIGLFWPDSDPEAGRHSLYQSLHVLRRSLGSEDLFLGSSVLQLNPERISSDIAEFDEAIERGAHERAVRVYRGPFLDGFRLDQAPLFEQWQDAERARRSREYGAALEALAAMASARGDTPAAIRSWRRLATEDPVSTRAALGLIEALVAGGDRASALQFATVHASLVRQQLDADPDPAVEVWIARLRSGDAGGPAAAETPAHRGPPAVAAGRGSNEVAEARERELKELERALADRYQISGPVEEGTVLLSFPARERREGRPVVLHVFRPHIAALATGERVLEALERNAELHDPRIVPVRDVGTVGGLLYFATPEVQGLSLRDRLARERPLPVGEAVAIAADLVDVLVHAHSRGIRHGDLRPKHVLLTGSGIAVASLGVDEALDLADAGGSPGSTAIMIGAPAYLSPEQLAGETTADERSDLYSFGCVVFEMLAGEPPFTGSTLAPVLSRKLSQPAPSLRAVRESVPIPLDQLVSRCLARLPADRFRTALELREALRAVGPGDGA
jgi:serine/threonine-protein kinase